MWRKQVDVRPSSPPETPAPWSSTPADPAPAARHASRLEEVPPESRTSAGLRIRGEISGDSSLYFEGSIEGAINLREADLVVGPAASVRGHVQAREVRIEGRVEGDVHASARIVLRATSHVEGDLTSPRIAIEDGARFTGRVEMARPSGKNAGLKKDHSAQAPAAPAISPGAASPATTLSETEPEQLSTGLFDAAKYAGEGG